MAAPPRGSRGQSKTVLIASLKGAASWNGLNWISPTPSEMPSKPHDITQGFQEACQGAPSHHEAESTASLKQGGDSLHIKWNSKNKNTPGLDIPIIKFRYEVQGSHTHSYFLQGRGETINTNSQSMPHPAYWDFPLPKVPESAMPLMGTRGRSTSKVLLTPPSFKQTTFTKSLPLQEPCARLGLPSE